MPKINAYIDNLDEKMAEAMTELARVGRNRFEVVLDRIDGDHIDTDFHFRLVELNATQQISPDAHVELMRERLEQERAEHPLRTIHVGGLAGSGPVMELHPEPELDMARLAKLLASIINLAKISPRVLGIEDSPEPAYKRIMNYLRKR